MAAAKKSAPKAKPRRRKYKSRRLRRHFDRSPEARLWRLWTHDVDTLLHSMVKNPDMVKVFTPAQLVAKAEAFADAYHAMQARRRPASIDPSELF
jgi:hypothetical protein